MSRTLTGLIVVLLALAAAAGGVGYWIGHRGGAAGGAKDADEASAASAKPEPAVAPVTVTPIRRGTVSEQVTAYGTVVAPPNEVRAVSVPFECRVTKMRVAPGQVVASGQPLVEVEGSAATQLAYQEARNAVAAAQRDLDLTRQRFEQKLATNAELFTAENALQIAKARLQSLEQTGAGSPRQLTSEVDGIVSKIDVQVGQVVAAGNPLVEVAAKNRIEVRLLVEPEDVAALGPGHTVVLTPVEDPGATPVAGQIRLIAQRVDPATRLVEVLVALPADAKLMLESFVAGRLNRAAGEGLIVPRDAVLPADAGGYVLFTVNDGKAVKHPVRIGVENDRETQIIADDLKAGDLAVVSGNYELDDGMAVQVLTAATTPAAEEPSGEPAATQPAPTQPAASQPIDRHPVAAHPSTRAAADERGGAR